MNRQVFRLPRKMLLIAASIALILLTVGGWLLIHSLTTPAPDSPEPIPTETPQPTAAERRSTQTAAWEPVIEEINGVPMALVPAGCFQMGREAGGSDESPVHEVCFEEPFWIDVYEVTNEQYGAASPTCKEWSSDGNQPRICINWSGSLAHCETRGARLPTEAEWEYAARGPDGLVYPWGNEFDGTLVNFCDQNCTQGWEDKTVDDGHTVTAPVGSYPGGISWVGAFDLSGNVDEWVNDWYDDEYYGTLADGVVNPQGPDSGSYCMVRGGSWKSDPQYVRAAHREGRGPLGMVSTGFRCAVSYGEPPAVPTESAAEPTPTAVAISGCAPEPTPLPAVAENPHPFQGNLPPDAVMQLGQGQFSLVTPSPDGTRLAAAGSTGVKVYRTGTFEQLWMARVGDVAVTEWSPDSAMVAVGLPSGDIYVMDGQTGAVVYEMTSHTTPVTTLDWAPTSDRLLSAEENGTGMIWDFRTSTPPISLIRTDLDLEAFAEENSRPYFRDMEGRLTPNGKWYATFYGTGCCDFPGLDGTIAIWDAVTGTQLRRIEAYPVINVIWLDDERLMTISNDGIITTWNAMSGEQLAEIEGMGQHHVELGILELEPSPGQDLMVVSEEREYQSAYVYNMATGQHLYKLPHVEGQIRWYPDGEQFIAFDSENHAAVWHRAEDGVEIRRIEGVMKMGSISPDWQTLYGWSGPDAKTLSAWDMTTGERTSIVTGSPPLYSVSWSPDGNYVAAGVTAGDDQAAEVLIWDVRTAEIARTFDLVLEDLAWSDRYNQVQVAWSPDGSMLAAGSEYGTVWDMQTGDELSTFGGIVSSLAWSPDSTQLAIGGWDTVTIIDPQTGSSVRFFEHQPKTDGRSLVAALDWSDDGQWIASGGSNGFAFVWDASTGEIIMRYELPDGQLETNYVFANVAKSTGIPSLALSPDGQFLVVGTVFDTKIVFDNYYGSRHEEYLPDAYVVSVANGEVLYQLGSVYSSVGGIDWSPDGTQIAMGFGAAGNLYMAWHQGRAAVASPVLIWDAKTGTPLYTLAGHPYDVHAVAFSPDGTRLASVSMDGTVLIWAVKQ